MNKLDRLLSGLDQLGWESGLSEESLVSLCKIPLRGDSYILGAIAGELASDHQPITLRGLFYRVVSCGYFPSTDDRYYKKLGKLLTTLRRYGWIPYEWIVDNIRSTIKTSSWSGLQDFTETVKEAYRKDFWASLPVYVHIFVEKDAMTGVIEPVTRELDVPLSPVRGYVSDSYAHEIGKTFCQIDKPIRCYYIGDFDPSGFDLERSLREKIQEHSGRPVLEVGEGFGPLLADMLFDKQQIPQNQRCTWERLALVEWDFADHDLYELPVKKSDSRSKAFIEEYGERCAEVDALSPNIIRDRVREAIMRYVDQEQWSKLQEIEKIERQSWESTMGSIGEALR